VVHQYKNNGYNIVLDVNSGAIHVVDEVSYDVIAMFEEHSGSEIIEALKNTYDETASLIIKSVRQLSKHSACISPMTATWPASIVLRRKGSIMEGVRSCPMRQESRHLIF
jgi:hypothetical protein